METGYMSPGVWGAHRRTFDYRRRALPETHASKRVNSEAAVDLAM